MEEGDVAEAMSPMSVARAYVHRTRAKRELERELNNVKKELDKLQVQLLEHVEAGSIPASFKLDGASVFTREEVWASPADGDHARLAEVLREIGLTEYLPRTVNSHSISAMVREHYDKETGEFDAGLDPRLLDVLKVTKTTKAVVNG